jgi:hypothetical protein
MQPKQRPPTLSTSGDAARSTEVGAPWNWRLGAVLRCLQSTRELLQVGGNRSRM